MPFSAPTRGFRLHYERSGRGTPIVLVHGSPGDHTEYSRVVPLLGDDVDVVTPDLRGFGKSDKHLNDVGDAYALSGQVDGLAALLDELRIADAVLCGYDIGSFTVQALARKRPDLVRSLVIAPPVMGVGRRILGERSVDAFLHAILYKTSLVEDLIDGRPEAVRAVLRENLVKWSPPGSIASAELLDHLTENHSAPGAFLAGIMWFRHPEGNPVTYYAAETRPAPADRFPRHVTVLWPDSDPLFPVEWSDTLGDFYRDHDLHIMANTGHFSPVDAPEIWARHILEQVRAA
ncbi:alpha/beta fold hydrolase [Nocardia sp. BMG111209]|uniref:alpha/beta fold hydrolase n=1 Tax=Nocardia sp. BMG111209 TaxID=1160137 RepID=UPI000377EF9C|nr:alpha/beta hydrolase [Nocardia sp. BMG111209]